MRLKLVPQKTNWDFFRFIGFFRVFSITLMALSVFAFFGMGLNYGIDFQGGTSIRTESQNPVDIGAYRTALGDLDLGDLAITEVFDPGFDKTQNVAMIRIQAEKGKESISPDMLESIKNALTAFDPHITFSDVDSIGPKVSGELIQASVIAVILALFAVLFYIWIRFEWQFSLGAILALTHDITLTIGVFAVFQIKFDQAIIAALLTIVGYSLNDTVVLYDRVRENLIRYKTKPLGDVLNLSINETLSRTLMTSLTTLLALLALLIFGGDVIRGFVFAMIWGVIVGTYSSVFIASDALRHFGVKRDWTKPINEAGTHFGDEFDR